MSSDWLPHKREELLHMAKTWISVLNSPADNQGGGLGPPETWAQRWRVTAEALASLESLTAIAEPIFEEAAATEFRGGRALTERLNTAFGNLDTHMRYMYRHFFLEPELSPENFAMMLLHAPDHTPTPSQAPTAQIRLETFLVGPCQLGYKAVYISGDPRAKENKGFSIKRMETNPGEPYPTGPDDFPDAIFTHRKRDIIVYPYGSSGKIAHFIARVENEGKSGPWGPITSAVIP
jgi:hypothetical protein